MLCPKCAFDFDGAGDKTCPACGNKCGSSLYLDGSVKIDDNSIIIDEVAAERKQGPGGNPTQPGLEEAEPHAGDPPRYAGRERRRAPRQLPENNQQETPPAPSSAKSLAVTAAIGAVMLFSAIGAGVYHLKYGNVRQVPAGGGAKILVLPQPGAPGSTFKNSPPESQPEPPPPVAQGQPEAQPVPIPHQAPVAAATRDSSQPSPADTPSAPAALQPAQNAQQSAKPVKESARPGSYELMCGSFKKRIVAQNTAGKLKKNQYPAFVEEADLGAKGRWFRVKIGGFSSKEAAEKIRGEIKKKLNIEAMATRRK